MKNFSLISFDRRNDCQAADVLDLSIRSDIAAIPRSASAIIATAILSVVVMAPLSLIAQDINAEPWYETALVGMEIGPTGAQFGHSDPSDGRYCSLWNGQEIVRKAVAAKAEYLVLWARDGDYAYYNSKLLPKVPGCEDRDPLLDAVEEARKHDLPLISYCVVQQGGHFLEAHPEWAMRDSDGNTIARFCFNSGYLKAMKQIVAEQLAYGIDGFHIDMLDQGFGSPYGCWCESCNSLFRERYGRDMPAAATWDGNWDHMLQFRYDTSELFEKQLTAHIKSLNPAATVDYNYHGNPPFSFEVGQRPVQHAGNADFVTGETGVWGFSALGVGLNAQFYRAANPGRPYQVAIQRGVRMYHDQTTRPLNDMRWETLTLLAHGAFVTMIDKTGFEGQLDPIAYQRIGQVLAEARRKRKHFGQAPVYDIGLYFSSRTRDWMGRENPASYFQSFQGAHRACALEHLQFGVVFDESVSLDVLKKFPVVCLCNVATLSQREVDLLHQFVTTGGKLLITGQSGQFDQYGKPLERSMLAELIGANVAGRLESQDNWVRLVSRQSKAAPQDRVLSRDIPADWPFLVKGPATIYEPVSARAVGELLSPSRTNRQLQGSMGTDWPMSAGAVVGPGLLVHRLGKGTVITCAGSPDFATASEHAIVEARILFRNVVRALHSKSRIKISAPVNVEAVVTDDEQSRTLRIHYLAYNPTPRTTPAKNRPFVLPGMIEETPIFRTSLVLPKAPQKVTATNPSTQIRIKGQRIDAIIEDIHEVLAISY